MHIFRRGDIVRCVDPNGVLSLNRIYAIMRDSRDPVIINDLGFECDYYANRFQLVEPASRQHSTDKQLLAVHPDLTHSEC